MAAQHGSPIAKNRIAYEQAMLAINNTLGHGMWNAEDHPIHISAYRAVDDGTGLRLITAGPAEGELNIEIAAVYTNARCDTPYSVADKHHKVGERVLVYFSTGKRVTLCEAVPTERGTIAWVVVADWDLYQPA